MSQNKRKAPDGASVQNYNIAMLASLVSVAMVQLPVPFTFYTLQLFFQGVTVKFSDTIHPGKTVMPGTPHSQFFMELKQNINEPLNRLSYGC